MARFEPGPELGCSRSGPITMGTPSDDLIQEIEELVMSVNVHDLFWLPRHLDQVVSMVPVMQPPALTRGSTPAQLMVRSARVAAGGTPQGAGPAGSTNDGARAAQCRGLGRRGSRGSGSRGGLPLGSGSLATCCGRGGGRRVSPWRSAIPWPASAARGDPHRPRQWRWWSEYATATSFASLGLQSGQGPPTAALSLEGVDRLVGGKGVF